MIQPLSAPPGDIYWRKSVPPKQGHKMLLRTLGGVAVIGVWRGHLGEFYSAWCPLPKSGKPPVSP